MRFLVVAALVAALCAACPPALDSDGGPAPAEGEGEGQANEGEGEGEANEGEGEGEGEEPITQGELFFTSTFEPQIVAQCGECHVGERFAFASLVPDANESESRRNYQTFL